MTTTDTKPKVGDRYDPAKHAHPASATSPAQPAATRPAAPDADAVPSAGDETGAPPTPKASAAGKARPSTARADAAPKRGPGRPSKADQRVERLGTSLASLGLALTLVNPLDGMAVIQHSPGIADALGKVAVENPRIAKFLDGATEANAWIGLAVAVTPLVLAILANHGVLGEAGALLGEQGAPDANAQGIHLGTLADVINLAGAGAPG